MDDKKIIGQNNNEQNEQNVDINLDSTMSEQDQQSKEYDKNAIFFEKFEKSKKDFLKEKRQKKLDAKKSLLSRKKMMGFENKLREEDFIKKIWIIFGISSLLLLAYASVIMAFLGNKFNGTTDTKWVYANYFSGLTKTSVIFSGISLSLIPLPYLFLMSAWFIGINSVHESKYFVSTNIVILVISGILLLLVIPLSSVIFHETINFSPIPATGE